MRSNRSDIGRTATYQGQTRPSAIVAECLNALATADADRLDQIRDRLRKIESAWSDGNRRTELNLSAPDLLVLERVLQMTRANFDLMVPCRPDCSALEYVPRARQRGAAL